MCQGRFTAARETREDTRREADKRLPKYKQKLKGTKKALRAGERGTTGKKGRQGLKRDGERHREWNKKDRESK